MSGCGLNRLWNRIHIMLGVHLQLVNNELPPPCQNMPSSVYCGLGLIVCNSITICSNEKCIKGVSFPSNSLSMTTQ